MGQDDAGRSLAAGRVTQRQGTREDRGLAQAYGEPIPPCRRSQCPHGDLLLHMAMARAEGPASPELSTPPDGQNTQLRGHWAYYERDDIGGILGPVQQRAGALVELLTARAAAEPAIALGGALGALRHSLRPAFQAPHPRPPRILVHPSVRDGPVPNRAL